MNGCYSWKVSHPNAVYLETFPSRTHPECSNFIELSNKQSQDNGLTIWLTAVDQNSWTRLNAQVRVASIERISLEARFNQIGVNDKLHLHVRANDKDGHVFSSLDGLQFEWVIESGQKSIRFVPKKDRDYLSVHRHYKHEDEKYDDDTTVKALAPGRAKITVKILEPGYEKVPPSFIDLKIVEFFKIEPEETQIEPMIEDEILNILPVSKIDLKA